MRELNRFGLTSVIDTRSVSVWLGTNWVLSNQYGEAIRSARETGADVLVTAFDDRAGCGHPDTLTKAKSAGVTILVAPYQADQR